METRLAGLPRPAKLILVLSSNTASDPEVPNAVTAIFYPCFDLPFLLKVAFKNQNFTPLFGVNRKHQSRNRTINNDRERSALRQTIPTKLHFSYNATDTLQ